MDGAVTCMIGRSLSVAIVGCSRLTCSILWGGRSWHKIDSPTYQHFPTQSLQLAVVRFLARCFCRGCPPIVWNHFVLQALRMLKRLTHLWAERHIKIKLVHQPVHVRPTVAAQHLQQCNPAKPCNPANQSSKSPADQFRSSWWSCI